MHLLSRTKRFLIGPAALALGLALLPGPAFADLHAGVCEGVAEDVFSDVPTENVHADKIDCIAHFGITEGVGDGAYQPAGTVRRDQMATFLVRLAEVSRGEALEPPEDDVPFTDITGNFHAGSIAIAYDLGITEGVSPTTYEPGAPVRRDQMASFVARTVDAVDGVLPDDAPDAFTDVEGNVHADNINALAEAGVVSGVGDDRYDPSGNVRRDQMATFLANSAGLLDAQDRWAPSWPAVDAENSSLDSFVDLQTGSTAELTFTVQDADGEGDHDGDGVVCFGQCCAAGHGS